MATGIVGAVLTVAALAITIDIVSIVLATPPPGASMDPILRGIAIFATLAGTFITAALGIATTAVIREIRRPDHDNHGSRDQPMNWETAWQHDPHNSLDYSAYAHRLNGFDYNFVEQWYPAWANDSANSLSLPDYLDRIIRFDPMFRDNWWSVWRDDVKTTPPLSYPDYLRHLLTFDADFRDGWVRAWLDDVGFSAGYLDYLIALVGYAPTFRSDWYAVWQADNGNSLSFPAYLHQLAQFDPALRNTNFQIWREANTSLSYPAYLANTHGRHDG